MIAKLPLRTRTSELARIWLGRLRRVFYFGLPPVILYIIFTRIDLEQSQRIVRNADLRWVAVGLALLVPILALGAARWHVLMRQYDCSALPFRLNLLEYWKSLVVGLLTPGSLGSDAYRVIVQGRRNGLYLRGAFVVGVEKLAALFSCATLLVALYTLLGPSRLPDALVRGIDLLFYLLAGGACIVVVFLGVRRRDWSRRLGDALDARLEAWVQRIRPAAMPSDTPKIKRAGSRLGFLFSFLSPQVALPAVGLSMGIYLLSAIQSQAFFIAYGHPIPFLVNLFVAPLLLLLYALPISFGGLGIREGAFIMAYSVFGVPAETALVVSVTGLVGNMIIYGIGAALLWMGGNQKSAG
jgi:glycosyltransferase 2 family protein